MIYSLIPRDVKKVIDSVLADRPYDKEQFLFYHLNRNHFNVKNEIRFLKHLSGKRYVDNFSRTWELQPDLKNFFHMPKGNWAGSMMGLTTPYSRKFLLDDTVSGLEGEFEIIVRYDGKRIDALTHEDYQETYNFARTRDGKSHRKLDVDPHTKNSKYALRQDMGKVLIIEGVQ
jgi:hypothetical protein